MLSISDNLATTDSAVPPTPENNVLGSVPPDRLRLAAPSRPKPCDPVPWPFPPPSAAAFPAPFVPDARLSLTVRHLRPMPCWFREADQSQAADTPGTAPHSASEFLFEPQPSHCNDIGKRNGLPIDAQFRIPASFPVMFGLKT